MENLNFLYNCSDQELDVLADIIREKGGMTADLYERKVYADRDSWIHRIEEELLDFGSNTFGFQKSYKEVLEEVCDKVDASYSSSDSIAHIEAALLGKVSSDLWDKMSAEDRRAIIDNLDEKSRPYGEMRSGAFVSLFRLGGFASYQWSVIVANTVSHTILNRGLSFAANAMLTKGLSVLAGPPGWILTAIWTVADIAGPAYRVIVPAVVYVAALRQIHSAS